VRTGVRARRQSEILRDAQAVAEVGFCDLTAGALHFRGEHKSAVVQIVPRLAQGNDRCAPTVAGTSAYDSNKIHLVLIFTVIGRQIWTLQGSASEVTVVLHVRTGVRARRQSGILRDAQAVAEVDFCDLTAGALHFRGEHKSAGVQIVPRLAQERTSGWWRGFIVV